VYSVCLRFACAGLADRAYALFLHALRDVSPHLGHRTPSHHFGSSSSFFSSSSSSSSLSSSSSSSLSSTPASSPSPSTFASSRYQSHRAGSGSLAEACHELLWVHQARAQLAVQRRESLAATLNNELAVQRLQTGTDVLSARVSLHFWSSNFVFFYLTYVFACCCIYFWMTGF
jgi:hypothetical protein